MIGNFAMKFDRHIVLITEPIVIPYDNLSVDKPVGGSLYFANDEEAASVSVNGGNDASSEESKIQDKLSVAEMRVAKLIAKGCTNVEIGFIVGTSHNTIKNHVTAICRKLKVSNRTQIAMWIFKNSEGVNDGQKADN